MGSLGSTPVRGGEGSESGQRERSVCYVVSQSHTERWSWDGPKERSRMIHRIFPTDRSLDAHSPWEECVTLGEALPTAESDLWRETQL